MHKPIFCLAPLVAALSFGCAGLDSGRSTLPGSAANIARRRPSATERAVLDKTGLVIAAGARVPSFHLGYTALFKAHEPVYFTADAMLHALHSSYDAILADIETEALSA